MRFLRGIGAATLIFTASAVAGTTPPPQKYDHQKAMVIEGDGNVGTIAIVEGNAYAQKGEIYYTRPRVGGQIRVNQFGQYQDVTPVPAFVKYEQNTRRHLKPNDQIQVGDIVQTAGDGWVKILFKDDSVLDVGPAAVFKVERFMGEGNARRVFFKMLYGRVRSVVAKKLAGIETYQIVTPNALMGVRGTEFLVNVFPDKEGVTQTEVICLHGQVSVDVPKHTEKGLIYHQPIVVNPGMAFSSEGVHGLGQRVDVKALPQKELRAQVARVSPQVNAFGSIVGSTPGPTRLLGTGVALRKHNGVGLETGRKNELISSFDLDYPPAARYIASPSGNFSIPRDFGQDRAAFGSLKDQSRFTGAAPIDLLPANNSRVTVKLHGL